MGTKIRILYIDDYDLDRELVKDSLENESTGFELTQASNKEQFEALLYSKKFDAILSDFNIAGFEGFQVLKTVRRHNPRIPVIIVTGTGSEEIAVKAMKQGASDYVIKRSKHILKLPQTILSAIEKQALRDERFKAEKALKESEQRYRNILENMLVGVYQVTMSGDFLFANQKISQILGYDSASDLMKIGNIIKLYARPQEREKNIQDLAKYGVTIKKIKFKRKDGKTIWVKLHTRQMRAENGSMILEGLMEDVTAVEKLEARLQQAQKAEAIGVLAGGIAHDFNNILSAIIGFTNLSLENVQKGTQLHEDLNEVLIAGNRAKNLVKQILTFSRKGNQDKKLFVINPVIKDSLGLLRSTIPTTIEIQENICRQELTIDGNSSQINQIIVNLVTNAWQAIEENGRIKIDLESVLMDEKIQQQYPEFLPGNYARLCVSDTGCGISEKNIHLIFDPYFTTKDVGKGTGLGLSVVHGIVKSHGGHIMVSSEVRKGTRFTLYFPLNHQTKTFASTRNNKKQKGGTERILLVDDDPSTLKMLNRTLLRMGYAMTALSNSKEALETFLISPDLFDLVITDMTMPNMTGEKLAQKIKQARPDIPVILCTGFSDKIDKETAKNFPIDGFLMKPADNNQLFEIIRRVLDRPANPA